MVTRPECVVESVTAAVKKYVPAAVMESQAAAEVSYVLPQADTPRFEALMAHIENNMLTLGIRSFGISMATMEEVFLR